MKLASCLTLSMLLLFACKSEQSTEATKQTKITRIGESAPKSDSVVSGGTKAPESPTAATGKADATESSSVAGDPMRSKSGLIVSGRITNPDGSPSSDVLVQLIMLGGHSSSGIWGSSPDPGSSARSDKNGRYEIATTNTAFMFLQAEKAGAARVLVNIFDEKSQFRPDRNQTRRVVKDFSMSPAVQISGKIIDESGAPVTSASIVAVPDVFSNEARFRAASTIPGMTTATVAADGTFTLQELVAEAYILTVENSESVPTMQSAQAPAENVTITMSREGSVVEGTVIRNNEGLSGANVSLVSVPRQRRSPTAGLMMTPRECKSGEQGAFRFTRLPAGQYVLQSEKDGARSLAGISLELAARETTSGIILTLSAGHTITGIVTDHQTGEPIEGVTVSNQSLPMYFGSGAKEEARRKPEAQTDARFITAVYSV